ncbi:Teichoic acids export ATP-binding protein TagH [Clostridium formicaceticum]|uniref:Teichoic acids export ATP-binding protein TagH n=1 Tax=Clostridium formicaceticum TaxID=1497 RepID=A0AAC9WEJ8_9CLOT|nr:Teichoic acids export ATP-binding protein TagH [Clostridium formicaceticum]
MYAVEIKHLSKYYKIYDKPTNRLKEFFLKNKKYHREFWALSDISLDIPKGKTVGIIGENGSGKSTLLKLICNIISPSEGKIITSEKIAAILELGAGFNIEFTGRENIYMYCSIMGLTRQETDEKMSDIIAFSELEEFIDQPLKTYSSGMYVRLAFSAAISVNPDILVVDEALAVGDIHFQLKCINKIKEFKQLQKTILFVTHDTYTVKNLCDYAVWIKNGKINLQGDVNFVCEEYERYIKNKGKAVDSDKPKDESKEILRIVDTKIYDENCNENGQFKHGKNLIINIKYETYKALESIVAGVAIFDSQGYYVCGLNTKLDGVKIIPKIGCNEVQLQYENISLLPGTYFIDVGFFEEEGVGKLDYMSKCNHFNIISYDYFAEGIVLLKHKWMVK